MTQKNLNILENHLNISYFLNHMGDNVLLQ